MNDLQREKLLQKGYSLNMLNRVVLGGGIYDIPDTWMPVLVKLDTNLAKLYPNYSILQVKSKFGRLRYYVSGVGEAGRNLIAEAEKACSKTEVL